MWKYGRPFPRKFSVKEAVAMQKKEGAGIQGKRSCNSSALYSEIIEFNTKIICILYSKKFNSNWIC
jgi:hypothetical protein